MAIVWQRNGGAPPILAGRILGVDDVFIHQHRVLLQARSTEIELISAHHLPRASHPGRRKCHMVAAMGHTIHLSDGSIMSQQHPPVERTDNQNYASPAIRPFTGAAALKMLGDSCRSKSHQRVPIARSGGRDRDDQCFLPAAHSFHLDKERSEHFEERNNGLPGEQASGYSQLHQFANGGAEVYGVVQIRRTGGGGASAWVSGHQPSAGRKRHCHLLRKPYTVTQFTAHQESLANGYSKCRQTCLRFYSPVSSSVKNIYC